MPILVGSEQEGSVAKSVKTKPQKKVTPVLQQPTSEKGYKYDTAFKPDEFKPTSAQALSLYKKVKSGKIEFKTLGETGKKAILTYLRSSGLINESTAPEGLVKLAKQYGGLDYMKKKKGSDELYVEKNLIGKKIIPLGVQGPTEHPEEMKTVPVAPVDAKARIKYALEHPTIPTPTISGRGISPRALPLKLTQEQQAQQKAQYQQEIQQAIENPTWKTKISAGLASGLTAGLSEAGMTPEQRAAYQQTVAKGLPYLAGQGIGMIGSGGVGEAALRTGGKLAAQAGGRAGVELAKQAARGAIIGGTQQGVMSATEGKTPGQIAQDVLLTMGLGAAADVGLNKLVGAIAKKYGTKAVTPEIQQAIENETRTLIDQNGYKVMSDGSIFKDGKLLKKSAKVREAGKVSEPIEMGVRGRLPEGTMKPEVGLGKSKISTIPGKYEVTSKPYMQAITDEIEKVQNFYGHSDILGTLADRYRLGISKYDPSTMDWKDIVKAETGVNVNNIEKGLDPVKLSEIGKEIRLARAAGVAPNIRIAKEKIELAPKPLIPQGKQIEKPFALTPAESQRIKSLTIEQKPLGGTETLPATKKPPEPIVNAQTGIRTPQAEIKAEKIPVKTKAGDVFDKLYARFVDFNRPIKKFGEKAYRTATVNRASTSGVIDNIIHNAMTDSSGNKIGSSLKELYQTFPQGIDKDLFEQYMRHKNNISRSAQGKPVYPDFTPEQSAEVVAKIDQLHPDWNEKQKAVTKWIDDFMQEWSVKRGLISPEDYANLRAIYPDYVPTNREFSELERNMTAGISGAKGIGSQPAVIRKATGSSRNIVPTIENMMNLVNRTVNIAKKNEVAQELLNASRENPNNLLRVLTDAEAEAIDKTKNNIVSVFENGKKVYMQVNDPELMRVFDGMSKSDSEITNAVRNITNKYKALITTKNPLFAVPNAVRDIQSAYINGSENNPVKYMTDLLNSYKDIATGATKYQQYKGLGGVGGNFVAGETKKFAEQMIKNPNLFVKALKGIDEFNNIVETAPRYAEFKRVLDKTGDPQKALYAAYDITTNFSRGGDIAKQADAYIPYLNAGIQGVDKMIRQFGTKPIRTAAKGVLAITIPTILLNEANKDNPNYQNLDNRTRDTYFVFPNVSGPKDAQGNPTTFIKLPKERTIGMIFGSLFDRFYSDDFKDYAKNLVASVSPSNPLTSNLFTPAMNIALGGNKTFTGAPIVPRSMENLSPELQYDEKTSEIAKQLGKATGFSPKKVDYLMRSYLGVLAQIGLPATTKSTYAGESDTQKLTKPITSRFMVDVAYNNKSVQNFYDNMDEITRAVNDERKLQGKAGVQIKKVSSGMNKYNKIMSDLNKKVNAEVDPIKQRALKLQIVELSKKANDFYSQITPQK